MAVTVDPAKADLHALVDQLPADAREVARRVLSALIVQAEYDTEPLTPEEEADESQGWRECQAGQGIPLEQVRGGRA